MVNLVKVAEQVITQHDFKRTVGIIAQLGKRVVVGQAKAEAIVQLEAGPSIDGRKTALFALIFLPPIALSTTDPDIFFKSLDYGGAFGVSTLFLVLPPFMVWAQRYGDESQPLMTKPMGKLWLVHYY